jgi:hypothetical protein
MKKITLWKRDDGDERSRLIDKIAAADFAAQTRGGKQRRFAKVIDDEDEARRRRAQILGATGARDETERERAGEAGDDDETNGTGAADHHVSRLADLLCEASGGEITRAEALRWLLHDRRGQALAARMRESRAKREDPTMTSIEKLREQRLEGLQQLAKEYGGVAVAKRIIADGKAYSVRESEFTDMILADCQRFKLANETPAQCFARTLSANTEAGLALRKALAIVKAGPTLDIQPVQVGGDDTRDLGDSSVAYEQLQTMAAELRRRSSTPLSEAQSFERVFSDPANRELAAKAHRRPEPTTNYAFPR